MSVQYNSINETHLSAEGGDSPLLYSARYSTGGAQFSVEGGYSYLLDFCPQHNTTEGSTENEEASNAKSLVDRWACRDCKAAAVSLAAFPCRHLCPCWDCEFEINSCPICGVAQTSGGEFLAKGGDFHLSDSLPQYNTNWNHFSGEAGDSYLPDSTQHNSIGTHFSAGGGYFSLPDSRSQYESDGTHFSTEGGGSDLPGSRSRSQCNTLEGSIKNEEASETESQVDR